MRVSREEMEKSHARIVESASWSFRERGIENTTVADIMNNAGLSHGGFYRHFGSKEALLVAALLDAFDEVTARTDARSGKHDPQSALACFCKHYLSNDHVKERGSGCPIAALAGEVARGSEEIKAAFGSGVTRLIGQMAKGESGSDEQKQQEGIRRLSLMVGAILIARASDPETRSRVLAACRTKV